MAWIKLYSNFWNHKKTIRLCARLGDHASSFPIKIWCYASTHQPNGDFTGLTPEEFCALVGIKYDAPSNAQSILQALQEVGFMDKMNIHDWIEHNGFHDASHEKAKKAALERWRKHKLLNQKECLEQCSSNTQAMPRAMPEERRGDKIRKEKQDNQKPLAPSLTRQFTDLWCSEWETFHGSKYGFRPADGVAASNLLKIESDVKIIIEIAKKAWALNGKHDFEKRHAIQLTSFSSQFNNIRLAVGSLKAKNIDTSQPFKSTFRRPEVGS